MKENSTIDRSETVKVAVRVRPLNEKEKNNNEKTIITVDQSSTPHQITVKNILDNNQNDKCFAFDYVFNELNTQERLYNDCAKIIVKSVLDGYNGTIFAYGQTGTGKTYTMEGDVQSSIERGVLPRSFFHIIEHVEKAPENIEFLVRVSFLEIYNDEVYDLLNHNTRQKLDVKEGNKGFYVKDLTTYSVNSVKDMMKVLRKGQKSRVVGATLMNPGSSRSHCIFTIIVEQSYDDENGEDHCKVGKLNMVDLAGSERQKKTHAKGDRLQEAKSINLSLSALGNVIKALVNKKSTHIPFRDSKLTKLLQDSLGGNTKTVMIANIGPAAINYDETISTLRYANRAKNIKNKPVINEDPKDALIRQMKEELQELQRQLKNKGGSQSTGKSLNSKKNNNNKTGGNDEQVVKEKKVYKTVEVWSGVNEKDVNDLKEKAKEAKKALENLHKKDEIKYKSAIEKAEYAAKQAEFNLNEAEEKLLSERNELKSLQNILKEKQTKLMKGGKELDIAKQKELELKKTELELKEKLAEKENISKKLDFFQETELYMNEQFNSIQDEIISKTKRLKLLFNKYNEKKYEKQDIIDENIKEEEELTDNIRVLTRQFQLKSLILEYFIPPKWLDFIEENSEWDNNIDQWRIPALEYSGNNMLENKIENIQIQKENEEQLIQDLLNNNNNNANNNYNYKNNTRSRINSHNSRHSQSSISGSQSYNNSNELYNQVRPITDERLRLMYKTLRKTLINQNNNDQIPIHILRNFMSHHDITDELQQAFVIALSTNQDSNSPNGDSPYLDYNQVE